MAKIRLKLGNDEIEVDSRDFYVDNDTLQEIIETISHILRKNQAQNELDSPKIVYSEHDKTSQYGLESLQDAETFEPEFNEPSQISFTEIKQKLRILETSGFFNSPRTVTETVQQLREYGWAASPLDVSKSLAKMASKREILKDSQQNRTHYFVGQSLISN
ncbi:MAG: hypothetical protein KC483_11090 [Nitrosarchaeum sp.]|nr:hypothetical protein [Nitrosarchaeum sp.]